MYAKNIFPVYYEFLPYFSSYLSNLTFLHNLMLNIKKIFAIGNMSWRLSWHEKTGKKLAYFGFRRVKNWKFWPKHLTLPASKFSAQHLKIPFTDIYALVLLLQNVFSCNDVAKRAYVLVMVRIFACITYHLKSSFLEISRKIIRKLEKMKSYLVFSQKLRRTSLR